MGSLFAAKKGLSSTKMLPSLALGVLLLGLIHKPAPEGSLQQDELYGQPAPVPRARPQVLVIVSDHGSGTTEFGNALNTHPCMFDVGEPFSNADGPWSSTFHIAECEGSVETRNAIFDAQTGKLKKRTNTQLTQKLGNMFRDLADHLDTEESLAAYSGITGDSPSLYQGLAYDKGVADYFVRLRDLVCKHIPEDMCPPSDCTITLKMFPQFVDAVTPGFRDKEDHESPCTTKRNEFGLPAWKKELASFEQNPKIATFTLNRNERDRQFSIFHRFSPPGSEFDCSMARAPYIFETVAKSLSDGQMMIESCWKDAAGAAKCLADALKLVGLKPEPMGDRGVYELISSQHLSDTKSATQNCKTDPHAIFKSLANNDVKQVRAILPTNVRLGAIYGPWMQSMGADIRSTVPAQERKVQDSRAVDFELAANNANAFYGSR
jgi:hypothetical protein